MTTLLSRRRLDPTSRSDSARGGRMDGEASNGGPHGSEEPTLSTATGRLFKASHVDLRPEILVGRRSFGLLRRRI